MVATGGTSVPGPRWKGTSDLIPSSKFLAQVYSRTMITGWVSYQTCLHACINSFSLSYFEVSPFCEECIDPVLDGALDSKGQVGVLFNAVTIEGVTLLQVEHTQHRPSFL